MNAEWALRTRVRPAARALRGVHATRTCKERTTDLDDVLGRIQLNLAGATDAPSLARLPGTFVLVAVDLTPSEAAELDWERVLAVATDAGSPTYHTAILARSLGIPAVVGLAGRDARASRRAPRWSWTATRGRRGGRAVGAGARRASAPARRRERREERRAAGDARAARA